MQYKGGVDLGICKIEAVAGMRSILQSGLGAALALAMCAGAQAQSRGRVTPFRTSSPTSVRMARSSQFGTTVSQTGSRVIVISDPTLFSFAPFSFAPLSFGTFPVPGLGFDFAHLAAVTRNLKSSDISVLTTAQRLALFRSLTPVVPFAVPFLSTPAEVVVVQQPPVVLVQPTPPEEVVEPTPRARLVEPKETAEPGRPAGPLHDLGEFVLVRRDGRMLFAIAFTTAGDVLTYVTREGVRRSIPLADLDIETTLRMNEERGTTLHLPV